jgi:hypothetical protein
MSLAYFRVIMKVNIKLLLSFQSSINRPSVLTMTGYAEDLGGKCNVVHNQDPFPQSCPRSVRANMFPNHPKLIARCQTNMKKRIETPLSNLSYG